MALKAILDSIDDLPDDVKSEYKPAKIEDKDVFVLDVEGVDSHPGVKTLKSAFERLKGDKKKLGDDLKVANDKLKVLPDDFDAEEWLRLKALDDEGGTEDDKKKKRDEHLQGQKKIFEDRIKALGEKHTADLAAKDAVIAAKDKEINGFVVDGGLTTALVDAGVDKKLLPGAKALLGASVKTIVEDGKTRAFFDTDMGEAEIGDFVKSWVQSDAGKAYVPPATGGGAGGGDNKNRNQGDADNPFSVKSWNKTKQGLQFRADQTKAERQAKAAGWPNLDAALKAAKPLADAKA